MVNNIVKEAKGLIKNSWYVHCMEKKSIKKHSVLLESNVGFGGIDIGSNILCIIRALRSGEFDKYQVYYAYVKGRKEQVRSIFKACDIQDVTLVEQNSFAYFKLLAQAKYVFNDVTFPRRFIKRPGQIYVNTWHGTSFKKLGKDVPSGAYAMGNTQRNFLMADYLVVPSHYAKDRLEEALNLKNLYQGTWLYGGYPRNQAFYCPERSRELRQSLGLENKRVYCYLPTWRGTLKNEESNQAKLRQKKELEAYFKKLDKLLNENEVFYVRLHPFVGDIVDYSRYRHIAPLPKGVDYYEVLALADCLVTDYSSVFYDYANNSDGKIIFFCYDEAEFEQGRSSYGTLEQFPFPRAYNVRELIKELRSPKNYDDTEFKSTYCPYDGPDAAKLLCRHIFSGKKTYLEEKDSGDGKKNLLFYVGGIEQNGLTTSFLNLMAGIDREKYHYFASFQEEWVEKEPSKVGLLPDFVRIVPMAKGWNLTFMEAFASFLYYKRNVDNTFVKKYLKRFYQREYTRNFGYASYEWCIHFNGYERKIIGMFQEAPCKRAIFVHNDMLMEIKTKGNQHFLTLQSAYREYDAVAAVTQDIYDRTLLISGKTENLHVIHNCHAYQRVLARAEEELTIDGLTSCTKTKKELKQILESPIKKFITIGRFSPEKGHGMLVEAFAGYLKESPDCVLFIIGGGGKLYEETKARVENLGISDSVVLIKAIKNPMPILKRCDLFLLSSLYEGLGLVILEADTLGLPVVSTEIIGPTGFMKDHGGYLVPATAEGLQNGMKAYDRGEVPVMHVDYEAYNRQAVKEFMELIDSR